MDRCDLSNGTLRAAILLKGAELCSLMDARGTEMMWQAGPAWPRHAPILFPIVGRLKGDRLLHDGRSYGMTQHGFARDRMFTLVKATQTECRFVLRDDAASRAIFPFSFALEVGYALGHDALIVRYSVSNPGPDILPASVGAHPAFRWPLADGIPKAAHSIEFSDPEPAPIRRVVDGLMVAQPEPTPIRGRVLALDEALFAPDAIIMDQVASRSLRFSAEGGPSIDVAWDGFHQLGLWSKPAGAPFLCIEPWFGYSSPAAFDGEFTTKPGLMLLEPGAQRSFSFSIRVN